MQMTFEYGFQTIVWFSSLRTESPVAYAAVLAGLFLCAILHEALAAYRSAVLALPTAVGPQEAENGLTLLGQHFRCVPPWELGLTWHAHTHAAAAQVRCG